MKTYTSRARKVKSDDFNWNLNRLSFFATLKQARFVADRTPGGAITFQ